MYLKCTCDQGTGLKHRQLINTCYYVSKPVLCFVINSISLQRRETNLYLVSVSRIKVEATSVFHHLLHHYDLWQGGGGGVPATRDFNRH